VAVADGHRLPVAADRFDGAWTGRVALADPDDDTQVLDIDDQEPARRVLRFRPTRARATARCRG
jgi:hypothetical protein